MCRSATSVWAARARRRTQEAHRQLRCAHARLLYPGVLPDAPVRRKCPRPQYVVEPDRQRTAHEGHQMVRQ